MPATAARIGFVTEKFRRASSVSSGVEVRHGSLARESEDPVETHLDSITHAQTVANDRQALLSAERRRFTCVTADLEDILAIDYVGQIPVARYVDTERDADMPVLVAEITIDFDKGQAALEVWG